MRKHNALAIITINDAFSTHDHTDDLLEECDEDKLQSKECIYVTISGPAIETLSMSVCYKREEDQIVFGSEVESAGDELNLLEGWASTGSKSS